MICVFVMVSLLFISIYNGVCLLGSSLGDVVIMIVVMGLWLNYIINVTRITSYAKV